MTVLVDTGVLYAFLNRDDARHADGEWLLPRIVEGYYGQPIVIDLVVAELFNLIRRWALGRAIEEAAESMLFEPEGERPKLVRSCVEVSDLRPIAALWRENHRTGLSYTDAALVFLREALELDAIATFDRGIAAVAPVLHVER